MKTALLFVLVLFTINYYVWAINEKILYPPQRSHFGRRVVGGANAKPGSAPYQVSVQYLSGSHFCGGAILNQNWIITAAHCVRQKQPSEISVLTGTQNLKCGGKRYLVSETFMHSRFDMPSYHNDIALIKLRSPIAFNNLTQPIKYSYEQLPNGAVLTLTGWGYISDLEPFPTKLQVLDLKYVPYEECKRRHYNSPNIDIGHVCTLNKAGEAACQGDSGGPLTYKGKLVAVVNWGIPCALGYPDAHASISYYHDFIRTTINSN